LPQTGSADHAADLTLLLHHGKYDWSASGEMIENLFSPPPPRVMFTHERTCGVHHPLIVRIALILIEAFG
jgi:hypothetical protein